MKFGALMCSFKEKGKIKSAIKQFEGTPVSEVVVACSKKPWKGNLKRDNTAEIALRAGATVKLNYWKLEEDQKNWGMEMLADMDWVFISAPDMYMTKESIMNAIDYLTHDVRDKVCGCHMKTYWQNLNTIIKPDWSFRICAIKPDQRFQYSSQLYDKSVPYNPIPGVIMHHLSWVKTDEEIKTKLNSYTHADEIIPHWFRNVWSKFHIGMTNFHPVTPSDYSRVVRYELPNQIRKLLDPKWIKRSEKTICDA